MKSTLFKKGKLIILGLALMLGATAFTLNNGRYYEIAKNLEIFSNIYKEINMLYVDELDPGLFRESHRRSIHSHTVCSRWLDGPRSISCSQYFC